MMRYLGKGCIDDFCLYMNHTVVNPNIKFEKKPGSKQHKPQNRKVIVYFHNLSYDGRMFVDQNIIKITMASNRIIEMVIEFENKKWLYLRDSYLLIPSKLANFPSMFGTDEKEKKVFPYHFVTLDMFESKSDYIAKLSDIVQAEEGRWNEKDIEEFVKIISEDEYNGQKIFDPETEEINVNLMVKNYVESDVKILSQGMSWFRKNMKEALGLDMTNYLSISAVAFDYFKKEAFDGENIYEYTGELRDFIRQAVYGGRCMTRGNNAYKLFNMRILDIDACSLYPSAMSIMDIPKGMPKKLENLDRHILERRLSSHGGDHIDAVIVRIRIKSIGQVLQFPLICERNKNGVVEYDNYVNAELVVDDIQLKELIKWQKIDYEIIEGIYWNNGVSTKINDKIKEIYERRREAKSQTPPNKIEQIYKLIMNSSYGKCIEMTKPYSCHIVKGQNYLNHLFQNYTNIVAIEEIISFDDHERREEIENKILNNGMKEEDDMEFLSTLEANQKFIFKEYTQYDNFFVPAMIGVRILSYSKKLMK